jgi:hypothetical protein
VGGIEDNGDYRMKRPSKIRQCIEGELIDTYRTTDIDPLLDEFESLRSQVNLDNSNLTGVKPFPSLEEFLNWVNWKNTSTIDIHDYFSQFRYEKMPEVGKEYEGTNMDGEIIRGELADFKLLNKDGKIIGWTETLRPIQTPTREEVIEKARQVLSEDEIAILTGTK